MDDILTLEQVTTDSRDQALPGIVDGVESGRLVAQTAL
jgi:hypothetical protein